MEDDEIFPCSNRVQGESLSTFFRPWNIVKILRGENKSTLSYPRIFRDPKKLKIC